MFKAIKEFFFGKPVEQPAAPVAPYKVEVPVATVVVDASLDSKPQVAAVAPEAVAPAKKPRANVAAKKIAAAKKPAAKKPAAPRKPKAPTA